MEREMERDVEEPETYVADFVGNGAIIEDLRDVVDDSVDFGLVRANLRHS